LVRKWSSAIDRTRLTRGCVLPFFETAGRAIDSARLERASGFPVAGPFALNAASPGKKAPLGGGARSFMTDI
jgi:hypothetical protein